MTTTGYYQGRRYVMPRETRHERRTSRAGRWSMIALVALGTVAAFFVGYYGAAAISNAVAPRMQLMPETEVQRVYDPGMFWPEIHTAEAIPATGAKRM